MGMLLKWESEYVNRRYIKIVRKRRASLVHAADPQTTGLVHDFTIRFPKSETASLFNPGNYRYFDLSDYHKENQP